MFRVEKFQASHLVELIVEPMNQRFEHMVETGLVKDLEDGNCITYLKDGKVLACGGITNYWQGRGQVWAMFSEQTKNSFVPIYRVMREWLKAQLASSYRRIEAAIPHSFEQGKRRALLLGFRLETEDARLYLPDGEDCSVYVMLKGE